jgi:hypothetical protein
LRRAELARDVRLSKAGGKSRLPELLAEGLQRSEAATPRSMD